MNEELKVVITAEISGLKEGVQEAQGQIDDLTSGNKVKFSEFSDSFTKVGGACQTALAVVGTAVAGAATALLSLAESTAEYRTGQEKLNSAFEAAGGSAETASQTFNDLYRVLGDSGTAVEAAGHLAQLTTNEQELNNWTTICQGVFATFGESLPIEGLTEAVNHTAKLGEVQGPLADALEWAGVSAESFNTQLATCSTEGERAALIQETLAAMYGEAAGAYEENAASILAANEAQAKLDASMAQLGETMEPIMTTLKELAADVLADLAPYLQDFAENHLPGIKDALSGLGDKIGECIGWIVDNWSTISTVATIVGGITAAIALLSAGLTAYNAVMTITAAVTSPVGAIILAIVAAIAALTAGIVLCVKNWDDIKAKVKEVVDNIKQWVGDMVEKVKEKFNEMKEKVSSKVEEIKENTKEKWENLKTVTKEKFEDIKETMGTVMGAAKETVQEKLDNIKQAYEDHGGGVKGIAAATMEGVKGYYTAGYDFIDNLTGGKLTAIKEKFETKMGEAKEKVGNALEGIKAFFNDKLGKSSDTVKEKFEKIKSSMTTLIEGARDKVKAAIDKIKSFFDFEFKWPKIPLPHFSISPPGWKIGDLLKGSIPSLSIQWYAKGGVFDSPTLFGYGNGMLGGLGENGAEAIVPLEKNTKWLDRIAERLGANSNRPVILQVDGKTFAETTISTLNDLTRQTGILSLNLA